MMFAIGFIVGALLMAAAAYSICVNVVDRMFKEFTDDEEWK